MPQITRLGHVGLFCNDLMKMRDFYSRVMGLTITDEDLERGICFLSADPEAEHHELALARAKDPSQKTHNVQQVSFKVESLDDVRGTTPYQIRQPLGQQIDLDAPDEELLAFAKSFEATMGPPRGAQQPAG